MKLPVTTFAAQEGWCRSSTSRLNRKEIEAVEDDDPDLGPAFRHERAQILKVIRL
jgi:hypothetical protein